jgi:hypothetical protein
MGALEDIMVADDAMRKIWQGRDDGNIPASMIEEVLLRYFPFTVEQLREILYAIYDADNNTYTYYGGRGGGPIVGVVTNVESQGEFVKLTYDLYFGDVDLSSGVFYDGPIYSGILTLKKTDDGFMYWSVEVTDDVTPNRKRDVALRTETAIFALGTDRQHESVMEVGDHIGDWTLSELRIQYHDEMINMLEAVFVGEIVLNGKASRNPFLEYGYVFEVGEEDEYKMPYYVSPEAPTPDRFTFMLDIPDSLADIIKVEFEEELECRITISEYRYVFAYMMAPPGATVVNIEID